ncbi:mitochondrial fission 1 protein-like [Argiope bruennichi]|uniref:mitochondrial fission 1 protein-like n=1 Tax=Argiope bruennichi TaxID=94029 RepID=UPI002494CDB3|nr:mitochondrial fission 1 protein-like [Argiope bruennichi]
MSTENTVAVLSDEDMKTLLNYNVSAEDREMYQKAYEEQQAAGEVELQTKFQYACCLTHSKNHHDLKQASVLFEELFKEGTEELKRDSLFYLSVVETKLKDYLKAKKYVEAFLSVEPSNVQAEQLKCYIEKHLKKDGITGMALVGTAAIFGGATAVVVGTLAVAAAVGFAFKRRK